MSLTQKIRNLRKKPRHVRERILLVMMIIIAVGLAIVWYFSFKYEPVSGGGSFVKDIVGGVSKSFSNPEYDKTFGTPGLVSPSDKTQ